MDDENVAYFLKKYFSFIQKMKFAYEWKELETIILNKAIQTQKNKQYKFSLIIGC